MERTLEHNNVYYLSSMLEIIEKEPLNSMLVEGLLDSIIPRDEEGNLLVGYRIKENGKYPAIYYPRYNTIEVGMLGLMQWVEVNGNDLASAYIIDNSYRVKLYLVLMAIMHEVEHSYQYLMAKGKIDAPCKMLRDGYKTLTELMIPKNYILPRPIKQIRRVISILKYKQNENEYLLERNAQYNSLNDLIDVAMYLGHEDIAKMFTNMRDIFGSAGYTKNCDGPIINTLRGIWMSDKVKKISMDYEGIDMADRYKLGLPIDQETREQVLALRK